MDNKFSGKDHLSAMPTELHLEIIGHLRDMDELSVLALGMVNRVFRQAVRPTHEGNLRVEDIRPAVVPGFLACKGCLCLRHATQFSKRMLDLVGASRARRSCAQCIFDAHGIDFNIQKSRHYSPENRVNVGGTLLVWCKTCGDIKSCLIGEKREGYRTMCTECVEHVEQILAE